MPAIGNAYSNSYQIIDYSNEVKSFEVGQREITALTLPDINSELATFETALEGVLLGEIRARSLVRKEVVTNTPPTSKYAQIESQWRISYQGATTEKPYSVRIPGADANAVNFAPDSDDVIISGAGATAATTAFIAAFQNAFRAPDDPTEGIVVTGMRFVGANV